jgi:hypothetical protein
VFDKELSRPQSRATFESGAGCMKDANKVRESELILIESGKRSQVSATFKEGFGVDFCSSAMVSSLWVKGHQVKQKSGCAFRQTKK